MFYVLLSQLRFPLFRQEIVKTQGCLILCPVLVYVYTSVVKLHNFDKNVSGPFKCMLTIEMVETQIDFK